MSSKSSQVRWLLTALGSSIMALAAVPVVLSFAVIDHGGSPSTVGLLMAAADGPFVASLLLGGVAADRFGRRRVALVANLVRVGSMVGVTILLYLDPLNYVFIAFVVGTWGVASGFYVPTITGLMTEVIPSELLQRANGMRGMVESVGQAVGPSVVGVVVGLFDPLAGAAVCAAAALVGAIALTQLQPTDLPRGHRASVWADLKEGWKELVARDWCWKMIVAYSFLHLITFGPLFVLGPVVAKRSLGGAFAWGLILGSEGLGALVGAWVGMRVRPRYPLRLAVMVSMLSSLVFFALGLGASLELLLVGGGVAGIAFGLMGVVWETYLQMAFPPHILSRISAYDWMGSLGLFPVGQILAGVLAKVMGVSVVLIVSGLGMVVISSLLLLTPSIRGAVRLNFQPVRSHPEPSGSAVAGP